MLYLYRHTYIREFNECSIRIFITKALINLIKILLYEHSLIGCAALSLSPSHSSSLYVYIEYLYDDLYTALSFFPSAHIFRSSLHTLFYTKFHIRSSVSSSSSVAARSAACFIHFDDVVFELNFGSDIFHTIPTITTPSNSISTLIFVILFETNFSNF